MVGATRKRPKLSETRTCEEPGCGRPFYGRGLCNKHYQAARARGLKPKTSLEAYQERLGDLTDTGCRLWLGVISKNNQAKFFRDGETLACRWAFKRFVGPLGKDEVVRHTCDNGACVNPEHWIKGSQADNIHDAVERSRTCFGDRHPHAVLSEDLVREIRAKFGVNRSLSYDRIGALYGVRGATVRKVLLGETWRRVA